MVQRSSLGNEVIAFSVVMIFFSGLAVFLRFLIRSRSKAPLAPDDWWILFSLVVFYVYMALQIAGKSQGIFREISLMKSDRCCRGWSWVFSHYFTLPSISIPAQGNNPVKFPLFAHSLTSKTSYCTYLYRFL